MADINTEREYIFLKNCWWLRQYKIEKRVDVICIKFLHFVKYFKNYILTYEIYILSQGNNNRAPGKGWHKGLLSRR